MKETHISYATAKALKEFLGDKAPEPMAQEYFIGHHKDEAMTWADCDNWHNNQMHGHNEKEIAVPAYQLHDLLSKEFCEAMVESGATFFIQWIADGHKKGRYKKLKANMPIEDAGWLAKELFHAYYFNGGLPAVEAELMRMMGK